MVQVAYSSSFKRAYRRRVKGIDLLEKKFNNRLKTFISNPYHPILKTHKLSGELADLWSFSVDYDVRVVFYFATSKKVVFVDIGSHDEVY
jgi:mRNA-degrading endonuclease YafQ of YafQ-DinJ toxin-antitoxin module